MSDGSALEMACGASSLDAVRAAHELDADAPGWFHSSDGWYWRRCSDGSVAIVRRIQEPDDRGARIYRITAAQRLEPSQWASVVAHVSARGETGETFRAALAFHEEPAAPAPAPDPDPAEDSYQAAVTVYRQSRALELDDTLDERPRCRMVCPHGDRCRLAPHAADVGCSHAGCDCNEPNSEGPP